MESQTTATLAIREVDVAKPSTEDKTKSGVAPAASSKAPTETDSKKSSKLPNGKDKTRAKHKEAKDEAGKAKKLKKTVVIEVEGSSDSDSISDLTSEGSDFSSDSDTNDKNSSSADEASSKKKLRSKNRRDETKAKKRNHSKRSKKPIKIQQLSESESDSDSYSSEVSDPDDGSASESDFEKGGRRATKRGGRATSSPQDLARLMLLQQQQQQQSPAMPSFNAYQSYPQISYFGAPIGNMGMMGSVGQPMNMTPAYIPPPQSPPAGTSRVNLGGRGGLATRGSRGGHGLGRGSLRGLSNTILDGQDNMNDLQHHKSSKSAKSKSLTFKRVDQVWDNKIHNYKLQDTAEEPADAEYEGYVFHVRRTFDWEGKYKQTVIDIKSKVLRDALQEVMGNIKGVSLVEDVPKLDPNLLFLYLDDIRKQIKALKHFEPEGDNKKSRKKEIKRNEKKRQQLKVLAKYLDKDYEAVKNRYKAYFVTLNICGHHMLTTSQSLPSA